MNPYKEIQQGEITIRTFKKNVQDDELVWWRPPYSKNYCLVRYDEIKHMRTDIKRVEI